MSLVRTLCVLLPFAASLAAAGEGTVISDFDQPFHFSYMSFGSKVPVADGAAHIVSKDGRGGAGWGEKRDLSAFADHTLALWIKAGPKNKATEFKAFLASGEAKRMFTYKLAGVSSTEFTRVLPEDGLAVSPAAAGEPDQSFDPARVSAFQVQGNWSAAPIDVFLDKAELVPPTPEMAPLRAAHTKKLVAAAERREREAERKRQEIEKLIANAPHPEDGARVAHIGAVAADTLAVVLQAGEIVPRPQIPYEPKDGDEVVPAKDAENVLCWEKGRIADTPKSKVVKRAAEGGRRKEEIGTLVVNENLIAPGPGYRGTALTAVTADQPRAYRIAVAKGQPAEPAAVFVKSIPIGQAGGTMAVQHIVYLKLAKPLEQGAEYAIEFRGVNTREQSVTYTHDPRKTRSEAVHVSQVGYRPGDPFKRAYLSLWMGTGGTVTYDAESFEILDDATGKTVHTGKVVLGFPADRVESIRGGKNQTKTNVYFLDFPECAAAGTYRVFVPGIGVSYPFVIGEEVWAKAFKTSMHGLLSHRSGIELGPPFTDYKRPRPMHPADGVKVFELDITYWNGEAESVHRSLRRLLGPGLDASKLKTHRGAWGGYMDAGDWDRRSQHLTVTWKHLELADLFPEYFGKLKLALPPSEANDPIPDVINEALWNLDCYRRLQRDDGGVGGGIESTSHPRPGEASWQESLLLGTFAPDPESSLRYAACAAKAARLLAKVDPKLSATYAESAKRAWTWANANEARVIEAEVRPEVGSRSKDPARLREGVRDMRALAAAALYRLTGQAAYHDAFKQATSLLGKRGDPGTQLAATFAYACLPDDLADAALKAKAIAWFEKAARDSLEYAKGNAFSITCRVPSFPLMGFVANYSAPESCIGPVLPRAHYLTGKAEYLAGVVAATQFTAGANPMNMTLTTGLGHAYPRHPLHVDSMHAGIPVPAGITVYGINDPADSGGHLDWAHTWYLSRTMVPGSRTWPAAEFYPDLGNWPPTNEYTVHQTLGPVSYCWGYLAARR